MGFVIGIDGGGTSCKAALASADGRILARARSGAANIHSDFDGARANIVEAARLAFVEAGENPELLPKTPAVLGLAGANVGLNGERLRASLPFAGCDVETDALIALEGAVGEGDGGIAILGTGTAYLARSAGKLREIGGWGFVVGDQASGARLGRDLLEETLLAHDGIRPGSPLTQAALDRFDGDPRKLVAFTVSAKPGDFGGFAPLVLEHDGAGDAVARTIMQRAIIAIECSIDALGLAFDLPVCLLGGLAGAYAPRLSQPYRARLRTPLQDALGGAVALAARRFGRQ